MGTQRWPNDVFLKTDEVVLGPNKAKNNCLEKKFTSGWSFLMKLGYMGS